jgi:hypothetical protein
LKLLEFACTHVFYYGCTVPAEYRWSTHCASKGKCKFKNVVCLGLQKERVIRKQLPWVHLEHLKSESLTANKFTNILLGEELHRSVSKTCIRANVQDYHKSPVYVRERLKLKGVAVAVKYDIPALLGMT